MGLNPFYVIDIYRDCNVGSRKIWYLVAQQIEMRYQMLKTIDKKSIIKYGAIILISFSVGFGSGVKYKEYQIKSALNELGNAMKNVFNSAGSNTATMETTKKAQAEKNPLENKVIVEVVNKDFRPSDWQSGTYEDKILIDVKFTNNTDKDIKGVMGTLTFYDIFDTQIYETTVSYDDGLPKGTNKVWYGGIDYNQFMTEHEKLRATELGNLKYKWLPEKIVYSDGFVEGK